MRDDRFSNPKASRFSGFHILATSFAAVAGVLLAAYQTLMPGPAPAPVQVNVAVDQQPATVEAAAVKANAELPPGTDLARTASFAAALKDGVDQRYALASLFDGNPNTLVTIQGTDQELNVLVSFAGGEAKRVQQIEYVPPAGPGSKAAVVDVAVLPDGQLGAAGLPIQSYSLPEGETQSFPLPGDASGRGLWLRIAGSAPGEPFAIGEFRIIGAN